MAKKKVANRLRDIGDTRTSGSPMPPMPGRPSETQLVEVGLFVSVTFFGTLLLVALAVFFGIGAIEGHLEASAEETIQSYVLAAAEEDPSFRGVTDVSADATGLDVHLRGTVDEEEMIDLLPELVKRIDGIGGVSAELEWLPPINSGTTTVVAAPIVMTWANNSATISGEISDETNRNAVVAELEKHFAAGVVADGFAVKEGAPSERDWLSKMFALIRIGADTLDEGELFVSADQKVVQFTGEYETRQARREARDAIDKVMAETTFAFVSGLAIPEPPAFTREEVEELQGNIDDLIEGKVVEFELNSDVLTPIGKALLDEIILALDQFPAVPIEIAGHTDNQGDPVENQDLSLRRAQAAFDYLIDRGQDPERFEVKGYGEDVPLVSNDTAEGRARNRRIEFKALLEE